MNEVEPETIATWTALVTVTRLLLEEIEAALKAANLPPLSWYDALLEIERAGKAGLRPYELKDRLLLPQYGTSRLLDRIIAAGLIEKQDCVEDGRGYVVRITRDGLKIRQKMWPIYAAVLNARLQGGLPSNCRQALADLAHRSN